MTDKRITPAQVRTIIRNEYEQERLDIEAAAEVAAWADAKQGKALIERTKPEGWHLRRQYGMTQLESDAYFYDRMGHKQGGPCVSILVGHQDKGMTVPSAERIRELNPAYFAAAETRQNQRLALLDDPGACKKIARALNNVHSALSEVAEALPNGPDGVPDRYAIIRGAGLEDVKVGRLQL